MKKEIIFIIGVFSLISLISGSCVQIMGPASSSEIYDPDCVAKSCHDGTNSLASGYYNEGFCNLIYESNCDCQEGYTDCSSSFYSYRGNLKNLITDKTYNLQKDKDKCEACDGTLSTINCGDYSDQENCEAHYRVLEDKSVYDCKWTSVDGENKCAYAKTERDESGDSTTTYFHPCDPTKTGTCKDDYDCKSEGEVISYSSSVCYKCIKNSRGCLEKMQTSCGSNPEGNGDSCPNICTAGETQIVKQWYQNQYTGEEYYTDECQECKKSSTNCYIWMASTSCTTEPSAIVPSTDTGKDCTVPEYQYGAEKSTKGFINTEGKCVPKTCENIYGTDYQKCGSSTLGYSCCAKEESCNSDDKILSGGYNKCCKENENKITSKAELGLFEKKGLGIKYAPVIWCNPKECKNPAVGGIARESNNWKIKDNEKIIVCCDENEIAVSYLSVSSGDYKTYSPICLEKCADKTRQIKDKVNKDWLLRETAFKDSTGKEVTEVCCPVGYELSVIGYLTGRQACVPKGNKCPKENQRLCSGSKGVIPGGLWDQYSICCPQYSVCTSDPDGFPKCVNLVKPKKLTANKLVSNGADSYGITGSVIKDSGEKIIYSVEVPMKNGKSYYLVRNQEEKLSGTMYEISSTQYVAGSELKISSDVENGNVYFYSGTLAEEMINARCTKNLGKRYTAQLGTNMQKTVGDEDMQLIIPAEISGKQTHNVDLDMYTLDCEETYPGIASMNWLVSSEVTEETSEENPTKCFVATAVYDDENAPEVETLREVRDNVLKKSDLGNAFVEFYYSGAGRETADFVKTEYPILIPFIKEKLDKVVEVYNLF